MRKKAALNENMKRQAVGALSESAKEQKIIMGNLKIHLVRLVHSKLQILFLLLIKQKEGAIKSANEKYAETKRILDEERYVNGTITQAQYEEALKKHRNKEMV